LVTIGLETLPALRALSTALSAGIHLARSFRGPSVPIWNVLQPVVTGNLQLQLLRRAVVGNELHFLFCVFVLSAMVRMSSALVALTLTVRPARCFSTFMNVPKKPPPGARFAHHLAGDMNLPGPFTRSLMLLRAVVCRGAAPAPTMKPVFGS